MRKTGIVVFALMMVVAAALALSACNDAPSGDNEAKDRIDYVEMGEMDAGIAYWEVTIKDNVDWEALDTAAQAATAVEAIVECVGSAETPSVDLCQVEGCQGEMGMPAFLWSVDQQDRILLYGDDGKKVEEYKLTQEERSRILDAKGFKLTEEWD